MKYSITSLLAALLLFFTAASQAETASYNKQLLPSPFPVYSNGKIVVNHPVASPDFKQVLVQTVNTYKATPGCYLMCYSHHRSKNSYKVDKNIYAVGQFRVAGQYQQGICLPTHYEQQDISALKQFKQLCNTQIDACKKGKNCWAGGGTGGWFGIQ